MEEKIHSMASMQHLVDELTAKSKRILEYSRNRAATGLHRERVVESFINRITPQALGVGSGFIYGSSQSSKQIDILVYDKTNFAPIFNEGGYIIVLPESVIQVIEVKSFLDKEQIEGAFDNILSTTTLNHKIHGSIFGFDGLSLEKTLEHINNYVKRQFKTNPQILHRLPEFIINLEKLILLGVRQGENFCYTYPKSLNLAEQFRYYFSALYYQMYGYQRKLHPSLPSLESQGFQISFEPGESEMNFFIPIKRSRN